MDVQSDFKDLLELFSSKEQGQYGAVKVFYINKKLFLSNKRAIGRKKDEADIESLQ